jgi:putative membrane protein
MWHMWDMPVGMGWWMAFGGLWMVVFWGGLIALIVWGIMKLVRREGFGPKRNPLDVAKERYARGEISKKEFEQLKRDLKSR